MSLAPSSNPSHFSGYLSTQARGRRLFERRWPRLWILILWALQQRLLHRITEWNTILLWALQQRCVSLVCHCVILWALQQILVSLCDTACHSVTPRVTLWFSEPCIVRRSYARQAVSQTWGSPKSTKASRTAPQGRCHSASDTAQGRIRTGNYTLASSPSQPRHYDGPHCGGHVNTKKVAGYWLGGRGERVHSLRCFKEACEYLLRWFVGHFCRFVALLTQQHLCDRLEVSVYYQKNRRWKRRSEPTTHSHALNKLGNFDRKLHEGQLPKNWEPVLLFLL